LPDRVILERRPLFVAGGAPPGPAGECEIVEDRGDDLTIRTRADRPAILVLQDSFAPGWSVTVNGRPAEILAANYAFRAVQVPAGTALVRFRYLPPGLAAGGVFSLAALVAVIFLFAPAARDPDLSAPLPQPGVGRRGDHDRGPRAATTTSDRPVRCGSPDPSW
jgi:hypothetical protein